MVRKEKRRNSVLEAVVSMMALTLLFTGFSYVEVAAEEIEQPEAISEETYEEVTEEEPVEEIPEEEQIEEETDQEETEDIDEPEEEINIGKDNGGRRGKSDDGDPVTFIDNKELSIITPDYEGVYDGQYHGDAVQVNITEGTTIKYSIDDGATWVTSPPQIRSVGTIRVLVMVENPKYRTVIDDYYLKVNRRAITVRADNKSRTYGGEEPELTVTITGMVEGEDESLISYTIARDKGYELGTYPIRVNGAKEQGNYRINYVNGTLTIVKMKGLTIVAKGYEGVYDGQEHGGYVQQLTNSTKVLYSTDNGKSWSEKAPTIRNVGVIRVRVKAVNPHYEEEPEAEYTLRVTKRDVFVSTASATKPYDGEELNAGGQISGLVDGETASLNVTGRQTDIGNSINTCIIDWGDTNRNNYFVNLKLGTLTVTNQTPVVSEDEEIAEEEEEQPMMLLMEPVSAEVTGEFDDNAPAADIRGGWFMAIALVVPGILSAACALRNKRY